LIERLLGPRDVSRTELDASEVQDVERDLVAFADPSEHVLDRNLDVVEHEHGRGRSVEPELLLVGSAHHAHPALDDESRELFTVHLGEDGEDVGERAVGDPGLLPVERVEPAISGQPRGRSRRQGVGAGVRLGQRVGADQLRTREPRQVARLLVVGAEVHDRERPDRRVAADRSSERGTHRQVFADVRGADLVEPETAVRGGYLEPQQIEVRGFFQELACERPVVCEEPPLVRQDLLSHELRRGLPEQPLFFGQLLAREHVFGSDFALQEPSARDCIFDVTHRIPQSAILAIPIVHSAFCIVHFHVSTYRTVGRSHVDTPPTRQYKPANVPTIKQLFDLTGRVAIVTGGSRGLGEEMADGLAEAGASLMLCARREEWLTPTLERMRGQGIKVDATLCDVSKQADVDAVVARTVKTYGQVDILVNNAGISWGARPEEMPLEKWQKVLDVNLTGAFLFSQAAGREMLKRRYGRIVNVASVAGLHGSVNGPQYAAYAASKAGLMGLTRELAASWGRQNIRVNAIAPGFFHSRLADPVIHLAAPAIEATSPIPRVGNAGELKGVAVFLASDASNYITGQVIVVDGGRSIA
jgi:gluconate 5-dehydrogenase